MNYWDVLDLACPEDAPDDYERVSGRSINEPVGKAKAPVAHTVRTMMYSAES